MKTTLSPREVAQAVGVSESSLKRWVDEGKLTASRTVGGHRRIGVPEVLRLVRESGLPLVRPELLGLAGLRVADHPRPSAPPPEGCEEPGTAALVEALIEGRTAEVRALLLSAWVQGRSVAEVCDRMICPAMRHIGGLWEHSEQGIFIEHRATDLCVQALYMLQTLLPPPGGISADGGTSGFGEMSSGSISPAALGGAPSGDTYTLPSLMAASILGAEGFRTMNLSAETPADVLAGAALQHRPRLVWLALSVMRAEEEAARLVRQVRRLAERMREIGGHLAVGGRALPPGLTSRPDEHLHVLKSFPELAAFARGLLAASPSANP